MELSHGMPADTYTSNLFEHAARSNALNIRLVLNRGRTFALIHPIIVPSRNRKQMQTALQAGARKLSSECDQHPELRHKVCRPGLLIWRKDSREAALLLAEHAPLGVLLGFMVHIEDGALDKSTSIRHFGLEIYEATTKTIITYQIIPIKTDVQSIRLYMNRVVRQFQTALGGGFRVKGDLEEIEVPSKLGRVPQASRSTRARRRASRCRATPSSST
jgi:hypothetical protein